MSEVAKVLYIVVTDEDEKGEERRESFSYTRAVLQSVLQLIGCKARHAFKISQRVFKLRRSDCSSSFLPSDGIKISQLGSLIEEENYEHTAFGKGNTEVCKDFNKMNHEKRNIPPFELYRRRTTVVVRRETFLTIVCDALAEYKYVGPNQKSDLILACRIRERKESVAVLLCGTSGCGKSTLSSLLASRLGITTVISTDSIRHMMRSFVDAKQNPLLWASTYHAGEFLDPVAVSEAKAKRKANKRKVVLQSHSREGGSDDLAIRRSEIRPLEQASTCSELISSKQMAIEGFKAQSEMVIDSLDRLITAWEERKESVVVEGVHLSLNFVMGLMKKHPSIIPFMIYISSEDKHLERFAVRAKYMTLDPAKNKYVKYIRNIRTIQEYLCKQADKHLVPKINNTNVDKSVASIHATVFSCLRRRQAGEQLYDFNRNTVTMVNEAYRNQCVANSFSSKGMFQLIQRKGSSRNLMAIVNTDGSVAKAWPMDSVNRKGNIFHGHKTDNGIGIPMYGPLEVGKAESVNLQFGLYGVSAWTNVGGTSLAGSIDESKGEATDTGSRYVSSCCSSPRNSDGPSKELKEDNSVLGSDEEIDDPPEQGSEEDFSDDGDRHIHEEASVDEESTRSDDEYDDLAMLDVREKGCWSDEDEELKEKLVLSRYSSALKDSEEYHRQKPSLFIRTRSELSEPLCSYSSLLRKTKGRSSPTPGNVKMRKRSLSIPALGKHGSSVGGPILLELLIDKKRRESREGRANFNQVLVWPESFAKGRDFR